MSDASSRPMDDFLYIVLTQWPGPNCRNQCTESVQAFPGMIGTHTGSDAVFPVVHAAGLIFTFNMTIRHLCTTVETAAIQRGYCLFFLQSNNHQVDICHQGIGGFQ